MTRFAPLLCPLLFVMGAVIADASPTNYTINFTTNSGLAPGAGSFTYDAAASLGSQFTAFTVNWDGFVLNFTTAANTGPAASGSTCGTTQNSASSFLLLTGGLCSPTETMNWTASESGVTATFGLIAQGNGGAGDTRMLQAQAPGGTPGLPNSAGQFAVTAAPEPATFILTLMAGALFIRTLKSKTARNGKMLQ